MQLFGSQPRLVGSSDDWIALGIGVVGGLDVHGDYESWLREGTEESHKQRNHGVENKPDLVHEITHVEAITNGVETPFRGSSPKYNVGGEGQFDRTDDGVENDVGKGDEDGSLSSTQPGVFGLGINHKVGVDKGNNDQGELETKKSRGVSGYVLEGYHHEDHAGPSTANQHGGNQDGEGSVVGSGDPSLHVVEFGLDALEEEIEEKAVLENGVNHGGDFSRRGVIPVGTDLQERNDAKNTKRLVTIAEPSETISGKKEVRLKVCLKVRWTYIGVTEETDQMTFCGNFKPLTRSNRRVNHVSKDTIEWTTGIVAAFTKNGRNEGVVQKDRTTDHDKEVAVGNHMEGCHAYS